MTSVWPALWPPWKRTTMSACSDSQSTILPLPSSPHWAPTTTTLAISNVFLCNSRGSSMIASENRSPDFSGSCFHCPAKITAGAARMQGIQPDKGSGLSRQARTGLFGAFWMVSKPLISPENLWQRRGGAAGRERLDEDVQNHARDPGAGKARREIHAAHLRLRSRRGQHRPAGGRSARRCAERGC